MNVKEFLKLFQKLLREQRVFVVPRRKNNDALIELGITAKTRKKKLLALKPKNYVSGPAKDRDDVGEVWVFRTKVKGHEIYIKLKIIDEKQGVCISFHKAEYSMT